MEKKTKREIKEVATRKKGAREVVAHCSYPMDSRKKYIHIIYIYIEETKRNKKKTKRSSPSIL